MLMFRSLRLYQLQRMLQNFQQTDKTLATIFANKTSNQSEMPVAQHSSNSEKKNSLAEVNFKVKVNVVNIIEENIRFIIK